MKLRELLTRLGDQNPGLTIYVDEPQSRWSLDMDARLLEEDVDDDGWRAPVGVTYFLEVSIAQEILGQWREYRTRSVSPDEAARVVLHYARFDATPRVSADAPWPDHG